VRIKPGAHSVLQNRPMGPTHTPTLGRKKVVRGVDGGVAGKQKTRAVRAKTPTSPGGWEGPRLQKRGPRLCLGRSGRWVGGLGRAGAPRRGPRAGEVPAGRAPIGGRAPAKGGPAVQGAPGPGPERNGHTGGGGDGNKRAVRGTRHARSRRGGPGGAPERTTVLKKSARAAGGVAPQGRGGRTGAAAGKIGA